MKTHTNQSRPTIARWSSVGPKELTAAILVGLVLAAVTWLLEAALRGILAVGVCTAVGTLIALMAYRRLTRQARAAEYQQSRMTIEQGKSLKLLETLDTRIGLMTEEHQRAHSALTDQITSLIRTSSDNLRNTAAALEDLRSESLTHASETRDALRSTSERLQALRELEWTLDSSNRERERHLYRQVESLLSLHFTLQPHLPLPNLGGWALSADVLAWIVKYIMTAGPRNILELGSGASTVVTALALERAGQGHLTSIEEDESYASSTNAMLVDWGLTQRVTLINAPLDDIEVSGSSYLWYAIRDEDLPAQVDLVVVDGPSSTSGASRYPALPVLADRVPEGGVIILDDAHREAERQLSESWHAKFPEFHFSYLTEAEKGAAVFTRLPGG